MPHAWCDGMNGHNPALPKGWSRRIGIALKCVRVVASLQSPEGSCSLGHLDLGAPWEVYRLSLCALRHPRAHHAGCVLHSFRKHSVTTYPQGNRCKSSIHSHLHKRLQGHHASQCLKGSCQEPGPREAAMPIGPYRPIGIDS